MCIEHAKLVAMLACERERRHYFVFRDPELGMWRVCPQAEAYPERSHAWVNPAWLCWSTLWGDLTWDLLGAFYQKESTWSF